jgi:predicted dehydrogenase
MATAIVGTGFIGPVHVEALRRLGRDVVGVLGSTLDKSRQTAQRFGIPRAYGSFAELLGDPEARVVHLASPNRVHYEQCKQALAAGKHVVCEKPLALDSIQSRELETLAVKSGLVAAVCYNVRYYPLCLEARERIAAGALGTIHHVTGAYVQDWLLHETDFNWRVLAEEGGKLRAVADIGTHWLDLMQSITGAAVTEVCADLKTALPTRQRPKGSVQTFQGKLTGKQATEAVAITTEDYGSVLLRFDSGAAGAFTVSQVSAGRKNCLRFEIAGSKGSMAWDSERPNKLWLGQRDRPNEVLLRDPALLAPAVRPFANYPGGHNEGFPDTFKQLFRAIYEYLDRGDYTAPRSFPTFAEGHREVLLCEAIGTSARERRWVAVS